VNVSGESQNPEAALLGASTVSELRLRVLALVAEADTDLLLVLASAIVQDRNE